MNYIEHIRENQGKADIILVSSHDVVRGNSTAFVKLLEGNYEMWIVELMSQMGCIHRPLGSGQFLSDVL